MPKLAQILEQSRGTRQISFLCIGLFFFPDHCIKQIDSMLPWVGVVKTDARQHEIYFLNNLHPVWSSLGFWFQFFDEHTRPFLPPGFLTPSNRAFSFTWPASMQICWSKRKAQLHWIRRCCDQHGRHPQVSWLTRPPFHFFGTPIGSPWRHISDYIFYFYYYLKTLFFK